MRKIFFIAALTLSLGCFTAHAAEKPKPHCTVVIASDLHFDMPPETDQYHHVVAINRLGETKKIDGVIIAGDIFDKAAHQIQSLYRQRWDKGGGERQIHYDVYPTFGNHDISPENGRPAENKRGFELNMALLDSVLDSKLRLGEIKNIDRHSRSYSFDIGDVHFVDGQLAAGDTTYAPSNLDWIERDLKQYASDGRPVVYIQHYGFDSWAQEWWPQKNRDRLFEILKQYNLAAFFVGHTHSASLQYYRGCPVVQVNNAWKDDDGRASFVLLEIDGNRSCVTNYEVMDGNGTVVPERAVIEFTSPILLR